MLQIVNHEWALELAIIEELSEVGTCTFDKLSERLPSYSWHEKFSAVDRLMRDGIVVLSQSLSLHYVVSLAPTLVAKRNDMTPS